MGVPTVFILRKTGGGAAYSQSSAKGRYPEQLTKKQQNKERISKINYYFLFDIMTVIQLYIN